MSEWGDKLLTEADNARLRAENEKLRVELTDLRLKSCPSCGIKVKNEELRELVRDMMRFFEDGDYCTICEKVAECESFDEYGSDCLMRSVFRERMAELGGEVE